MNVWAFTIIHPFLPGLTFRKYTAPEFHSPHSRSTQLRGRAGLEGSGGASLQTQVIHRVQLQARVPARARLPDTGGAKQQYHTTGAAKTACRPASVPPGSNVHCLRATAPEAGLTDSCCYMWNKNLQRKDWSWSRPAPGAGCTSPGGFRHARASS